MTPGCRRATLGSLLTNRSCYASEAREQAQEREDLQAPRQAYEGREHGGRAYAWRDSSVSCYRPLKAFRTPTGAVFNALSRHDIIGDLELPCGQCIGCRMRRASDWELRVMHEASLWPRNCFVTLTYGRDRVPADGSLDHRDFQLFMKRVRKHVSGPVRFYMCGEYGPLNLRPHYHACLFNVDFRDDRVPGGKSAAGAVFYNSATLEKLWTHGICTVQDLTPETASYCARYIMKKALGASSLSTYVNADGVIRKPEYAAMSLKPGIGARWFERYSRDVFPHDVCVQRGVERRVPKYYDRLYKRSKDVRMDAVEFERQKAAVRSAPDNTDERRRVREVVHLARVSKLGRNDL